MRADGDLVQESRYGRLTVEGLFTQASQSFLLFHHNIDVT
jgi:hypothetical protein